MLCRNFELVLIKEILKLIAKLSKSPCTIVHGHWPNFAKIEKEKFFFLYFFLIHIHVLMLCRKFEQIPITFGFFTIF